MHRLNLFVVVVFVLISLNPAYSQQPEFRAVWITRFDWPSENPEQCKARIVDRFEKLAANNFNAAVFQIRGETETLYPSPLEPWSPLVGAKDLGFDPAAFAIEEAHKRGIAFHAYINAMPLRSTRFREPPADPNHIYFKHGPDAPVPWLCLDENGRPTRQEYLYLSAGVPEVQAYLRQVIMDVVHRYDVDGIHLDRIRFPDPQYIHDPISEQRFRGRGNPNRLERPDWQRAQLDQFVNDVAAEIRAAKPHVLLSCSAWGIYNRHHLEGYGGFSSGYHDYYQDTWNWCRIGAMDLLMPMIYWNMPDPKPNYHELLGDFVRGVGAARIVGGQSVFSVGENTRQIQVTREMGAMGTVIFDYRGAERRGLLTGLRESLYTAPAPLPVVDRVANPKTGTILGTVRTDKGLPLVDAWVSLARTDEPARGRGSRRQRVWTSGSDGRFAFLDVPSDPLTIIVNYPGAAKVEYGPIVVWPGQTTRVDIAVPGSELASAKPFLDILSPADRSETTAEVAHLLGRTSRGCTAKVGDVPAEVYSTGAFARDGIPLAPGKNRIEVMVTDASGASQTTCVTVTRREPMAKPPSKIVRFIEPNENIALLPGDLLNIKVQGPTGCRAHARGFADRVKVPLTEVLDDQDRPTGVYTGAVRAPARPTGRPLPLRASFYPPKSIFPTRSRSEATVEIWEPQQVRVGETREDQVGIVFGLHTVRLGGPFLARAPKGTRFEIVGQQGSLLKIRLAASLTAWVRASEITRLAEGTPVPHNYCTSCDINGDDQCDKLSVSLRDKVVFAVRSETDPSNRLYLDLFNTHDAMTWISHKSGAKIIGPVTAEQMEEDHVRLTVPLNCRQIWGYWTEAKGNVLTLYIRRPPHLADAPASPLKGLTIAIEAGHGGSGDGAIGLLGTKEKTVNLTAVGALEQVLERRGARTVLLRPRDSSPTLQGRVDKANEANADLMVSIHANAAGNDRGFLRVSGTSTYFKDKHCHLPAAIIYRRLLDLGWNEFGVVGSFSYYPLQNTRVPGILIEQGFMSNPSDEARLLDREYQRRQARAIADGLEEFLNQARETNEAGPTSREG